MKYGVEYSNGYVAQHGNDAYSAREEFRQHCASMTGADSIRLFSETADGSRMTLEVAKAGYYTPPTILFAPSYPEPVEEPDWSATVRAN